MNDSHVFVAIIISVTIIILTIIGGCINSYFVVERMVKNGADPIKAYCSIHGVTGDGGRNIICLEASRK